MSNAYANGYEKGRASVKQPDLITPADVEQLARIEKLVDKIDPYGAQPEQKPVAKVHVAEDYHPHVIWMDGINAVCFDQEYLYITPPQREWQGLTDEEIEALDCTTINASDWNEYEVYKPSVQDFARAIEAKLKQKNA